MRKISHLAMIAIIILVFCLAGCSRKEKAETAETEQSTFQGMEVDEDAAIELEEDEDYEIN